MKECHDLNKVVQIHFIQVSAPDYPTLWNALSSETLAGDLKGTFKELVEIQIHRIRDEKDISKLLFSIIRNTPDILGLSVEVGSLNLTNLFLEQYANHFASFKKSPLLIFGNKLPTYFPSHFLKQCPNSIVVVGEGEESFRGIIRHKLMGESLENIPNLVYTKGREQTIRTFMKTPDLSLLVHPPSTATISETVQSGSGALLQASRGCPWSLCRYCTIKSFRNGKKWEGLPVKRVLENINHLVSAGITELEFADDEFIGGTDLGHLERIYDISDGIEKTRKDSGRVITFKILLAPYTVFKTGRSKENYRVKQLLKKLKRIGLVRIYLGGESGCQSQLKRYNRGSNLAEMKRAINVVKNELQIDIDFGFIMFDPFLTVDEMLRNIKFFREAHLIRSNHWPFRPLAINVGSRICDDLGNSGLLRDLDMNFMKYNYTCNNEKTQEIFSTIETLSRKSRNIFHALKTISRRQYSEIKMDNQTRLARFYVEHNAEIYLTLMEKLCHGLAENAIYDAEGEINSLIRRIKEDIENKHITEKGDFLLEQIRIYFKSL
jgi:Radical SAM superfamily